MKKPMFGIAILGFVFVAAFFGPAAAQKIETVNGVTVVSNGINPTPPKGQSAALKLVEEQTFGLGENPDESFSEADNFAVDAAGTVFGLDGKDHGIKVFDRSGKFLRRISRLGQGPGELQWPGNILLTDDDKLLINDPIYGRLSIFKTTGEHVEDVPTVGKLRFNIRSLDARGNVLGTENRVLPDDKTIRYEIKKYDSRLKPLFTIDEIEFDTPKINLLGLGVSCRFGRSGNIFYGRNSAYEIKVLTPEGRHFKTIRKDYRPEKLTPQDINEMLEKMSGGPGGKPDKDQFSFPETYPPLQDFILDDQDRLYVRTYAKGEAKGEWVVDVFDPEGRFVSQFATKVELKLIKDGKAYGMEETEDGFTVIKRYALVSK
jgi:hypothetical protein